MITVPSLLIAVCLVLAPFGFTFLIFLFAYMVLNLYARIWRDRNQRVRRERAEWRNAGYAEGYLAARLEYEGTEEPCTTEQTTEERR